MSISSKKSDSPAREDQKTMLAAKFFKFVSEKLNEKGEPGTMLEDAKEVSTRFDRAVVVLTSNPFYESPIEALQSMEDVIRIKNENEVRDQLR